jgi:hypothetical protein
MVAAEVTEDVWWGSCGSWYTHPGSDPLSLLF